MLPGRNRLFAFFAGEVSRLPTALGNNEQLFKQLFSAEYGRLCKYALSYMQDEHSAEDVVQDTFIKVWETKQDLIQSPDIRYYLITAVRNNCISVLRKQKNSSMRFPGTAPEPEPEPFFTATQQREDATERNNRLAAALNSLPLKCKEVFLMVKMHSMSYRQVADTLNISIKTVENQMGKALRVLRENTALTTIILWLAALLAPLPGGIGCWLLKNLLS